MGSICYEIFRDIAVTFLITYYIIRIVRSDFHLVSFVDFCSLQELVDFVDPIVSPMLSPNDTIWESVTDGLKLLKQVSSAVRKGI